ncbi:uncharacterized protein LOC131236102 [Magnolia sinica]|uniref:uncharacterized protein LOC131236102 n=1 Tax=Magnolia sinica TaxID=86752 RepID=UPI0026585954|nr:uncharacterized protein LOC131236102 [Magnolia sinica]
MMSTNKMPVLCKFGGDFIWESNKVYYKGGTNRIIHVDRGIDYINLISKVLGICKFTDISSIKYKYPGLDLDSLVLIENDDDVSNMMEAFPQSSEPIQLFIFCGQNLSIPIANPSFLMQNADNENDQALLRNLHESNGTIAPSSHNTNVNNNDVPSASNDLRKVDCLLMDNQMVDSCVNDMPKIMSVLKEDQEFEDANAFHKALREYAIRSNFEYKRTRSSGGRYQAKCIKDNCSWRIHAWKLLDKPTFKIKSLKGDHTCNVVNESTMSNTRTHRQASRKWIADLVKDRLQKKLCCTPKDIVDEISREYGIKVSYDKAWRGKELAVKERNLITTLMEICEEIQRTNQGSTAKLSRLSDNSLRLFVAYKASIHGFKQACRPVIRFDCMKMEGKWRGVWLFAMAFDAEDDWFPISYAFVESKNVRNWKWFCDELAQVLKCIPKLTFISDRQEGILEVVSGIFPYASHRYSQWQLLKEILEKFECWNLYWLFKSAVYAGGHSEFDACMHEIHDKYKEAWNIVKDINPKHWATSHFEEKLYFDEEYYHLDWCDWWFGAIEWHDLPITGLLVKLHDYMIDIFNEKSKESLTCNTTFVPGFEEVISKEEMFSENYCVSGGAAEFEVRDVNNANADPKKVDLEQRTCSCLEWQRRGHPCGHAIAAIKYSRCNIHDYVDVHFKVDKYRETYSEVIHPLHLANTSLSKGKKRKYVDFEERCLV